METIAQEHSPELSITREKKKNALVDVLRKVADCANRGLPVSEALLEVLDGLHDNDYYHKKIVALLLEIIEKQEELTLLENDIKRIRSKQTGNAEHKIKALETIEEKVANYVNGGVSELEALLKIVEALDNDEYFKEKVTRLLIATLEKKEELKVLEKDLATISKHPGQIMTMLQSKPSEPEKDPYLVN